MYLDLFDELRLNKNLIKITNFASALSKSQEKKQKKAMSAQFMCLISSSDLMRQRILRLLLICLLLLVDKYLLALAIIRLKDLKNTRKCRLCDCVLFLTRDLWFNICVIRIKHKGEQKWIF